MKKTILIFGIICFLIGTIKSQNNAWDWASELSTSCKIGGVKKMNDTYSYIAGTFSGIELFGNTPLNSSNGGIYFCKVNNSTGSLSNIKQLSDFPNYERSVSIEYDFQNNLILGIGHGQWSKIQKLDTLGNKIWEKSLTKINSNGAVRVSKVVSDFAGNVYALGEFDDAVALDGTQILTGKGMFILKFDAFGFFIWSKTGDMTNGGNQIKDAVVDNQGNVYFTGNFGYTISFGSTSYTSLGQDDIYLGKINPNSNFAWVVRAGSINTPNDLDDVAEGIVLDNAGNIYLTGAFANTIQFSTNVALATTGKEDIFIAKYNNNGIPIWAKKAGGIGEDRAYDITINSNQELAITGFYEKNASFGSTILNNTSFPNVNANIFVSVLDNSGNFIQTDDVLCKGNTSNSPSTNDNNKGLFIENFSNSYFIVGRFLGTANFGNIPLGQVGSSTAKPFIGSWGELNTSTLEIDETSLQNLYPNPFSTTINLSFNRNLSECDIEIFSIDGKMIHEKSLNAINGIFVIDDLSKLQNGIYIVMIKTNKGLVIKKVIKE